MIRRPPRSTRTDTLFPYTTLFRSAGRVAEVQGHGLAIDGNALAIDRDLEILPVDTRGPVRGRVERLTKLAVDIASQGRLRGGDQRAARRPPMPSLLVAPGAGATLEIFIGDEPGGWAPFPEERVLHNRGRED